MADNAFQFSGLDQRIIDILKKRGNAIVAEKYDKLKLINDEIHHKVCLDDKTFLDKF